jgi:hypothetical protein
MATTNGNGNGHQPINDPRELALVLADTLDHFPHILVRTGPQTALRRHGEMTHSTDPEAVQFCLVGIIHRPAHCGKATHNAADGLEEMIEVYLGGDGVGSWFEGGKEKTPAEVAGILRAVAMREAVVELEEVVA